MKNIHVLPTEKPSRLKQNKITKKYSLATKGIDLTMYTPQNIYITSDEEIKEDYVFAYGVIIKVMMFDIETLYFVNGTKAKREDCKKIILTTDQDLIKDGVQAIDDEFLEWFVKNPSCEFVEIELEPLFPMYKTFEEDINVPPFYGNLRRKIIIPKEEAKQETLEEIAEKYSEEFFNRDEISMRNSKVSYIAGAKGQAEQDKQEIQDLRSRLDFVHESSAKAIELIEALQLQTEGMYNEDTIRQVLSKLTLVNPVHLQMTSNGHGEFPDGYKLTEKGIDCIVEQLKK
jgi:hypothetical protein